MNTVSSDHHQHAVEPGAHAAEDQLAELHVDQRHHAADRGERVVHAVDAAARGVGGDGGVQGRVGDAEPDLLALHVAAGLGRRGRDVDAPGRVDRVAPRLGPVGGGDAGEEQDVHRRPQRPAVRLLLHHAAEGPGEPGRDEEDLEHLQEVGQRRRVLERMRRVGVEEAAAVGADLLDGLLARDRAHRDGLLGALERVDVE